MSQIESWPVDNRDVRSTVDALFACWDRELASSPEVNSSSAFDAREASYSQRIEVIKTTGSVALSRITTQLIGTDVTETSIVAGYNQRFSSKHQTVVMATRGPLGDNVQVGFAEMPGTTPEAKEWIDIQSPDYTDQAGVVIRRFSIPYPIESAGR